MRVTGRRAAVVAAFVGLLAALTAGGVVAPAETARPFAQAASIAAVELSGSAQLSAPSTGVLTDVVRSAHPAAVRTSTTDRVAASHAGGWAVAALLLVLAALALAIGVRRATRITPPASWRSAAAPRAPPVPFCT